MSWNEEIEFIAGLLRELEAAKKVADAAVAADMVGKIISRTIRRNEFLGITASVLVAAEVATLHAFGGTVREYRALTEGEDTDG